MSLVTIDDMDKLRPASEARSTASTAAVDIQIKAIAFQINTASNTGEYRAVFQDHLLPGVKEELENKGYSVKFIHKNPYDEEKHTLISWEE